MADDRILAERPAVGAPTGGMPQGAATRLQAEVLRLRDALQLAMWAMRAPLDDWKGEVERKALDAAALALGPNVL